MFASPARSAIKFKWEIGTIHSVADCDGFLDNSDPYALIRVGSAGTTDYFSSTNEGCEGDCAINQVLCDVTVTTPVDQVRVHIRDKDDGFDPWGSCNGDCDSNFGGITLSTVYDDKTWRNSGGTNTSYADGYNGDGDNDCADSTNFESRSWYYDTDGPTAPSSLTVTEAGNVYSSLTSTSASWGTSSDADSGIYHYEYCIGTSAGACNIIGWTDNGTSRSATAYYSFTTTGKYYWSVRATNNDMTTFPKQLRDSGGDTSNYHIAGAVRSDSTGFTIDSTPPTITSRENISVVVDYENGGSWSGWNWFPPSGTPGYVREPTHARVYFASGKRMDSILGDDTFDFSQGSDWTGSCGDWCADCISGDAWSPWDTDGRIGVNLWDSSNGCEGPEYNATVVEFEKSYGWYSSDPGNTIRIRIDSNSATTSADDSTRGYIGNIYVQQDCAGGWTSVWSGNSDFVTTFNPWSTAVDGEHQYCIRGCDTAGNCKETYDGETIKVSYWYRKDTTPPSGGAISYADGYRTVTNIAVGFTNATDGQSGISHNYIDRQSAPLANNVCGTWTAFSAVATDPPGSSWTDSNLVSGTCYKYRLRAVDNVGWSATFESTNVVKVDTSEPSGGSISYANGYDTDGNITLTLNNGSDAQSALGNRYLQRKEVSLADDTCGDFGAVSWTNRYTNPTTPTQADTMTHAKCYMYQFVVYNNAGLTTTYTSTNVVKVDTTAPAIGTVTASPEYNSGTTWYVISPFVLSMTISDPESGFAAPPSTGCQYATTGSNWSNADNLCSHEVACADGALLTLNMRSTDRAGLTTTGTSLTRTCDAVDPYTNINWTDDWTNSGTVNIVLTAVDSGAGIAATYYCVDTTNTCTPSTTYSAPFNVTCAAGSVCTQYVRYYSVDNVSNSEDLKSTRVRQDRQLPTVTDDWDDNCSGSASPQSPVTVNLTPDDGSGSGTSGGQAKVEYCVDTSNACTPGISGSSAPVYCAYLSSCIQYVRYRTTDYAGNTSGVSSACVKQSIQPPNWLDQWDPTDDTSGGATDITITDENTVYTHGPHSINIYDAPGAQVQDYYDWFKINMTAGKRYCFNSVGSLGDAYVRFYNSALTQLTTDDNSGGNQQFAFCTTPATSGWYYLRIEENGNNATWYGDINYWFTTVDAAPAATTNSVDQAYVQITDVDSVRCDCDGWPSGDTDFQMRGYIGETQVFDSGRSNDSCGSSPAVNVAGTKDIGRNDNPNLRIHITDEDGGLCEGWSCSDTLTNHTFSTFSAVGAAPGWHWLTQDNATCDSCYDDVNAYFNALEIRDRGVDAPSGLSVTTTDTGTNAKTRFSWNAVYDRSGISDYWFVLDDNSDFSSPIISKSVGTGLNIDVGYGLLTHGATYYWKVAARSTCTSAAPKVCSGGSPHVNYTSTSFTFTDDDVTQPNVGTFAYSTGINDGTTNFSVVIEGSSHTRTGDDGNETNACIAFGRKICSDFYPTEPSSGSNSYQWSSGDRNADSSTVPSAEMDVKTTTRTGGQVYWYLEDYSWTGEADALDGDAQFAQVALPEVTAITVNRPGKEDFFYLDRLRVKVTLQTRIEEDCSIIWPFSCTPNRSEPILNIQTNRYDGSSWGGWSTQQSVSGEHAWTTREYTLLDTTNIGTINTWNNGLNQIDMRVLLGGTMGADMIETEYEEMWLRSVRVEAIYDWHINSHSAVSFVPLTEILGTPVGFNCIMDDADNDRGTNKDCSPGASLDLDYDCVQGGGQGRSGSCTNLEYTVTDDDTTPPSLTFDAPSYINAAVQLDASASDLTQGDEPGVKYTKFEYASYSGVCGGTWTLIGQDDDSTMDGTNLTPPVDWPDCNPIFCVNWSSLPASDGRYCVRAVTEDNDDDRANDSLTTTVVDDNVIIDRVPPNNPTIASVVVDNGSCSGAALPNDTWQALSSDPCFTWNAAIDPGTYPSGVASYWVYYGSKCSTVVDGDGGYIGNVLTWTNDVAPGEGTFCFWMKVKDNAGNESTPVKLWTIKYDGTAPTVNTPDADNTDYNNQYVDGTFDFSATVSDTGSMLAENTCEYRCSGDGGLCNGVWRAASDDWSGTATSNGTCSITNVTCTTNAANISLEMRVEDIAGLQGTSTAAARTCDLEAPTCSISSITEALYNVYYPGTGTQLWYSNLAGGGSFAVGVSTADALSGVQKVNFPSPSLLTGCGDDTASPYACTFIFTSSTTQNGAVTITSYDNVNNTNTCSFTLTRDITAPTGGSISYTDGWYTTPSVAVTFTNGTDAGSGIDSRTMQRRETNLQNGTGSCDTGAWTSWADLAVNPGSSPYTDNTVASGKCYQYRYLELDRVSNQRTYTSTSTAKVDANAPNALACGSITLRSAAAGTVLTWGNQYNYTAPTGPYMEWANPGDNPASTNAGISGYYVYFGSNSGADPYSDGVYQTGLNFTNGISLTSGTTYYFKIKAVDRAGSVAVTSPSCEYDYSLGGYLLITQFDSDTADDPEGVLEPGGSDYELVIVKLMDESDNVITMEPVASKSIDVTLGNLGGTGAYISETSQGVTTGNPTTVTFNLSAGAGWVKIKAASPADQAITVTPTANGAALSGEGGRDQKVYLLVRQNSNVMWPGDESDEISGAGDQLIIEPTWSHDGTSMAYASFDSGCNCWQLFKRTHAAGTWGAATQLTLNGIGLRAGAGITWSADDAYVIFSGKTSLTELDLYAVSADGSDNAKTLAQLGSDGKRMTDVTGDGERWTDSDWSSSSCGANADSVLVSMADPPANTGADIWRIHGSKTNGLLMESSTSVQQISNLSGFTYIVQPRWSHDCTKIIFTVIDGFGTPSRSSIYMIKLSEATLPVSNLTAAGVYKIHECTTTTCPEGPAVFPSFSADDTMAIYSVDTTKSMDFRGLQQNETLLAQLYTGKNFDNYVTYIAPASPANYITQKVGESANNEFGLTQCAGANCPNGAGKALTYVTQSATTNGALRYMYLDTESTVTTNGGLMFMNGAVVAAIPSGALHGETRLSVSSPGAAPTTPDNKDLLVSTGDAREFFPDGVVFDKDILMIFHYDDADNNGIIDAGSPGEGLDENKIFVYYWCDAGSTVCSPTNSWIQLDGSIDPDRNVITVATNHFSLYDPKVLTRGLFAPQIIRPMALSNPHTYPNPWRTGDGPIAFNIDSDSSFNTQAEGAAGTLFVAVDIYDIRGKRVRTLTRTITGLTTLTGALDGSGSSSGRGLDLATWDGRNIAGRNVSSGVYLYHMTVTDGVYSQSVTGKLAIIK